MYGAGLKDERPFIVMENLACGDLDDVLPTVCTYIEKVTVILGIARGLETMHTASLPQHIVMHRDIKPKNIAFDSSRVPKLLDFGLARVVETRSGVKSPDFQLQSPDGKVGDETSRNVDHVVGSELDDTLFDMTGETGSLRYMAPEVAKSEKYNHKADAYSWAIVSWQIMSKSKPARAGGKS